MGFQHSPNLAFKKPHPLYAAHAVAFTAEPTLQPCLPWERGFAFFPFNWLPAAFTQAEL